MFNNIMLGFITLSFFTVSISLAYNFIVQGYLDYVAGSIELEALNNELEFRIKEKEDNTPS